MNDADLVRLADRLRIDAIRASAAAGSGHPTSAMSAADLMAVLMALHLHYDFADPANPGNDHLIFSKGHASPLLYAMFRAVEAIGDDELLAFRRLGSRLEGHPTPLLPWVDVATGSLGQGLPIGVGIALAGKRLDRLPYRVWVLCGDSEMAEGSMWEAIEHGAFLGLDNLTAIIDVNRLGQRGETMHGWDLRSYSRRAEACGWHAIEIDGHDVRAIDDAFVAAAQTVGRPSLVVARTLKGKGVKAVEDVAGAHGKPVPDPEQAIRELGDVPHIRVAVRKPRPGARPHAFPAEAAPRPVYEVGRRPVATRRAFGEALAALVRRRGDVVAIDAEVGNSTYLDLVDQVAPERSFQMYVAEQQMVAAAVGVQVRGWTAFGATFAAFLSRASDFVRMGVISRADLRLCGSHAGVSIGEDGPSQMGLEDLAAFRALGGSTVLYPSDPNQTAQLVEQMADTSGVSYIRTTRGAYPTLYAPAETFTIGGARVVRSSEEDEVAIVGAGVTVHEALAAADRLAGDGIRARVVDLYSIKPIDATVLLDAARATGGRLITVEDHWPEGGLGAAVLDVFAEVEVPARVVKLAVTHLPGSGTPAELLAECGIDAAAIVTAAHRLLERDPVGAGDGGGPVGDFVPTEAGAPHPAARHQQEQR